MVKEKIGPRAPKPSETLRSFMKTHLQRVWQEIAPDFMANAEDTTLGAKVDALLDKASDRLDSRSTDEMERECSEHFSRYWVYQLAKETVR